MTHEELIHSLALTHIPGLGAASARNLYKVFGSAINVFRNKQNIKELIPNAKPKLIGLLDCPDAFRQAEKEIRFIENNNIRCLGYQDEDYPSRLRECDDAPLYLFYKGSADLNILKVISIVGTRNITDYGKDICQQFIKELQEICPDVLIVSGLAYGVDIQAHQAALKNGFPTIGVLAHGLDRIYPSAHRNIAVQMLEQGGLLTEFCSGTNPDRQNFVCRNRIVAGMADATIVVESATKGGALITAELAGSYHRDCFAFPGRCNDEFSQGCNNLIRNNQAVLIQSAEDFLKAMRWDTENLAPKPVQREIFPELSPEEETVVKILQHHADGIQINSLVVESNQPIQKMSALLFEMEMKGIIRVLAGGVYKLM